MRRLHFDWRFFHDFAIQSCLTVRKWSDRNQEEGDEHDHAFTEMVLITGGSGIHRSANGDREVRPGTLMIIRPGVWHSYQQCRFLAGYDLCFQEGEMRRGLSVIFDHPAVNTVLGVLPLMESGRGVFIVDLGDASYRSIKEGFENLSLVEGHLDPAWNLERQGLFLALIGRIARFLSPIGQCRDKIDDKSMTLVVRAVAMGLDNKWSVSSLAKVAGVSRKIVTKRIKEETGLPPLAYVNRCRAERAARLLLTTNGNIASIGASVGWEDANYFSRRFHQAFGLSPSEYRRRFKRPHEEAESK